MDILRHGRHVAVEAPPSLRRRVVEEVREIARLYA
jgi:predicted DNA-binding transcriptional regulator YafY